MHAVALPQACHRAKWIGRLTTVDATSGPAPHLRPGPPAHLPLSGNPQVSGLFRNLVTKRYDRVLERCL
ncbi:hypothetical protein L838_3934 [Mycobacterium avium MAV_120709_2344]|nr:hypothetical protein L838_3934 [Mycobacterium avium MAV_120709_2344]